MGKLLTIEGWKLSVAPETDEPMVRDLDLAERLGFAQSRMIRKLIKKYEKTGDLQQVNWRSTVERQLVNGGGERAFTVKEAWLTQADALFIVAKSETPSANALTREVIRVFGLAMRGLLGTAANDDAVRSLRAELAQVRAMIRRPSTLIASWPVIGPEDAKVYVRGPLREIAKKTARLHGTKWRAELKALDNDLREAVGYPMAEGASWAMLPHGKLAKAHRKATQWLTRVNRRTARLLDSQPSTQLLLKPAA